jgi:hypothetical protein
MMAANLKLKAQIVPNGPVFTVRGQEARTLVLLIVKGNWGVGSYDFDEGPPFRLGAYMYDLRHQFELAIETLRDEHDGGWHARYRLLSRVKIVSHSDDAERAAA